MVLHVLAKKKIRANICGDDEEISKHACARKEQMSQKLYRSGEKVVCEHSMVQLICRLLLSPPVLTCSCSATNSICSSSTWSNRYSREPAEEDGSAKDDKDEMVAHNLCLIYMTPMHNVVNNVIAAAAHPTSGVNPLEILFQIYY